MDMPDRPVPLSRPPCERGFVPVTVEGVPLCVAASACGWHEAKDRPGPPPPGRENDRCFLEDLPIAIGHAGEAECFHLPAKAHRYDYEDGMICPGDQTAPDEVLRGCVDAFGRRVRKQPPPDGRGRDLWTLINGVDGWWWWGLCPPRLAVPCAPPVPPPPPPEPGGTPSTCPPYRIGLAACCGTNGVRLRGETATHWKVAIQVTLRFGGANGKPCDDDQKEAGKNYELHCGGRWCEAPDVGDRRLRVSIRYSQGVERVRQADDNAYWLWADVRKGVGTFWLEVCPGNNIPRLRAEEPFGDGAETLRPLAGSRREYEERLLR